MVPLSYSYKNLRPTQTLLDPENPRLPDGTSGDRDAINRLLEEGPDALLSLARDMAKTGESNPAELPIAIKQGSKYIILEGNRRFAALKLLGDSRLVDDEEYQKAFRRAASLGRPPKAIYTLVADTREEAEHWIVLRHTGENGGVGVRRWSASQTATHRRRANVTIDAGTARSITIADEVEETYVVDAELVQLVRKVRREKLTNIGRFFSPDVLVMAHLAIRTDPANDLRVRTLWAQHSAEQLRQFFTWAFHYLDDNPVDAYKNVEMRKSALRQGGAIKIPSLADATDPYRLADRPYGGGRARDVQAESADESLREELDSDVNHADDSDDEVIAPAIIVAEPSGTVPTAPVVAQREARPERFLFERLRLPRHPDRVQRLLQECRKLEIDNYPGIACVMVRVLVELSVSSESALALSAAEERDTLKHKIISMLRYLDPEIDHPVRSDRDLTQAFLEASELGIRYLNGFVHNPAVTPDRHLARRFVSAFAPLLRRIDEVLQS